MNLKCAHIGLAPHTRGFFGIRRLVVVAATFVACALIGCKPSTAKLDAETIEIIVRTILDQQVRDWNEGQVEKFMRGYAQTETTRFASGSDVSLGWRSVLERYKKKYPDRQSMGRLVFSQVEVTPLSTDAALAFGRWQLDKGASKPSGLFTLLFRNTKEGWRIVHDHTSAAVKE